MWPPNPSDRIRCPDARSNRTYIPEKVFEVPDHNDSQKTIRHGILGKHRHGVGQPECDWSGFAVPLIKTNPSPV